mgnify:CR=1 FL=1
MKDPKLALTRAKLCEVNDAIRHACYNLTGEDPKELLERLGWTEKEYMDALITGDSER